MSSDQLLSQSAWDELRLALPRGSQVKGRVRSVHPFGVFVDIGLDARIPVLLELIHFRLRADDPEYRIAFPEDYPRVGDEVEARILAYSLSPRDIRLTQLGHLEWIHSRWTRERDAGDS